MKRRVRTLSASLAAIAALPAHVAVGYLIAVSGLVAPTAVLAVLVVAWAAMLAAMLRNVRDPLLLLVAPVVSAGLWLLLVPGLGSLLGWTA